MLLLTRRAGESIIIGDGANKIVVTVVAVSGKQVRAGIDAPRSVSIHREEVYERIKSQNSSDSSRDDSDADV